MNSDKNHFEGDWNSSNSLVVLTCSTLALYNSLELILLILTTFASYRGLYFWSLILASSGIIPYVVGFLIEYFQPADLIGIGIAIDWTGWSLMVTGQSVVLYSRLWLVFGAQHRRLLNAVKWAIIIDGVVLHGMTLIVVYGSHYGTHQAEFGRVYDAVERLQMVAFSLQELGLSSLYMWKALDIIQTTERKRSRHILWQLFSINAIIIGLDVVLLTMEFKSLHVYQQAAKGVIYGVKLKMELAVLNKLIELATPAPTALTMGDPREFLDTTKSQWDITTGTPAFQTYPKWMSDLEKDGIRQFENAYSPTKSIWTRGKCTPITSTEEISDTISHVTTGCESREKGSVTELLYADAVRKMAK